MNPIFLLIACARIVVEAFLEAVALELASRLPQPPAPPAPPEDEQRATMLASLLAGRLWDRWRDPEGAPDLSDGRRPDAVIIAAELDDEDIRWLVAQITLEFTDGPDHPPLSHEVYL